MTRDAGHWTLDATFEKATGVRCLASGAVSEPKRYE